MVELILSLLFSLHIVKIRYLKMKHTTLSLLFFIHLVCIAQSNKYEVSEPDYNWGKWEKYQDFNIEIRVKNIVYFNKERVWFIEFKNNYNVPISFRYNATLNENTLPKIYEWKVIEALAPNATKKIDVYILKTSLDVVGIDIAIGGLLKNSNSGVPKNGDKFCLPEGALINNICLYCISLKKYNEQTFEERCNINGDFDFNGEVKYYYQKIYQGEEIKKRILTSSYDSYIENGDNDFNDEKYNNALSNYQQAKSYAQTESQMLEAQSRIARAEKAIKDEARKKRVDEIHQTDAKEDAAYATAASALASAMAFVKDAYSPLMASLKIQLGLGMEVLPLITNTGIKTSSQTEFSIHPTFFVGMKLGLLNKYPVSFHINPYANIGFNALKKGVNGFHTTAGFTGTFLASWKSTAVFKVFFEGGYYFRKGNFKYDYDAVHSGATTDEVRTSNYKYTAYSLGGGILFHIIKPPKETYIKPGVYFEKTSFYPKKIPYTLVAKLDVNIVSQILLSFTFSPKYYIAGDLYYTNNFEAKSRPYFGMSIIRQGNLITGKRKLK